MEIEILTGPLRGKRMSLDVGVHLVGRGVGPLPFQDPGLSQEHAKIHVFPHRFEVEDIGSTNGTYVNGERVAKKTLAAGDEVRLGPESAFRIIDRTATRDRALAPTEQLTEEHPRIMAGDGGSVPRLPPLEPEVLPPLREEPPRERLRLEAPPTARVRKRQLMRLIALAALLICGVLIVHFLHGMFEDAAGL